MAARETRYAANGDAQIAYQTAGAGPAVVFDGGTVAGLVMWDQRLGAPLIDAIAQFATVVVHDPRGSGRSDPLGPDDTIATQAADVVAVLDDASIDTAVILGFHSGGAVAIQCAVTYPERVTALLLANTYARVIEDDGYPGITQEFSDALIEAHRNEFGTGMFADAFAPSRAGDPEVRQFFAEIEQRGASRAQAALLTRLAQEVDVRDLLPGVTAPTIVMHSEQNTAVGPHYGRYIADHIPGARWIPFPGTDHAFLLEDPAPVLTELETLVTGRRPAPEPDRILATILFTDIVGSTQRAAALGDREWRALLTRHNEIVREELDRFRGREIDTAGDAFFATFDTPARAIGCAQAAGRRLTPLGIEITAGVHIGECEQIGDNLGGIAVHIGARIAALAGPGEVLVSSTVKELSAGGSLKFVDRGVHALKGVPDEWRIYAVE